MAGARRGAVWPHAPIHPRIAGRSARRADVQRVDCRAFGADGKRRAVARRDIRDSTARAGSGHAYTTANARSRPPPANCAYFTAKVRVSTVVPSSWTSSV